MLLTKEILDDLSADFPEDILQCKVQSYGKSSVPGQKANADNAQAAMMITYISHTDAAARLDEVCAKHGLDWSFQVTNHWTNENANSEDRIACEGAITISGMVGSNFITVTRMGVGTGKAEKDAYSDCLKRAAVNFGVGRSLYDQGDNGQLWIPWGKNLYPYGHKFSYKEVKEIIANEKSNRFNNTTKRQSIPKEKVQNISSQSINNTAATIQKLSEAPKSTETKWNTILRSETDGLFNKLGVTTPELKKAYYAKFGAILTPENHKDFNEFLKKELANKG